MQSYEYNPGRNDYELVRWGEPWRRPETSARVLYFAYGSNMDEAQMKTRCPSAVLLHAARLSKHRLAFVGRSERWGGAIATVERSKKARVWGLLYSVTEHDLDVLDLYEAIYTRVDVRVKDRNERKHDAVTYVLNGKPYGIPSDLYVKQIARAYSKHKIDQKAIIDAILIPTTPEAA